MSNSYVYKCDVRVVQKSKNTQNIVGMILLSMLKTIAACGVLLQRKKKAHNFHYNEPQRSAIIELIQYRSSNCDSVTETFVTS